MRSIFGFLRFIVIALLLLLVTNGRAEQWDCVGYLPVNGMSHQRVSDLMEDEYGQVWVSTRLGVDCITSIGIQKYTLPLNSSNRPQMVRLVRDSQRVMAYTNNGNAIYGFDDYSNSFCEKLKFREDGVDDIIYNISCVSDDCFWVLCKSCILIINAKGETQKKINTKWRNYVCCRNDEKTMLVGSEHGVDIYGMDGSHRKTLWSDGSVLSLYKEKGTLWLGTFDKGVVRVSGVLRQAQQPCVERLEFTHNPVRSIISMDDGSVLAGVDGVGVFKINKNVLKNTPPSFSANAMKASPSSPSAGAGGLALWLSADAEQKSMRLRGNGVYALLKDREQSVWVGCYTGGVTRVSPRSIAYDHIHHVMGNVQSLADNHVNSVCEDLNGNTWYATNNGLSMCTTAGVWHHYLQGKVFLTICCDKKGQVWTGGYGTGVFRFRVESRGFRVEKIESSKLTTDFIYSIVCDEDGDIWIGGLGGNLVCMSDSSVKEFGVNQINALSLCGDGKVLVACTDGLYIADKSTGGLSIVKETKHLFVYNAFQDAAGNIWFSTDGNGLGCIVHGRVRETKMWTVESGLPSNCVYGVQQDRQGRIWVSTDCGLAYLENINSKRFIALGYLENSHNEMNFRSFGKLANGNFIYGSNEGLVTFLPEKVDASIAKHELRILSIDVEGRERNGNDYDNDNENDNENENRNPLTGGLSLAYDENTLSVTFAAMTFVDSDKLLYSVMLEGVDKEWSEPSTETSVRYVNVPSGNHTLKIRCLSRYDGSCIAETSLKISVANPFWLTLPAFMLYALILFIFVWVARRGYLQRQERRQYDERMVFFTHTAHDLRTPVTLIVSPLNDLQNETGISEEGKAHLQLALTNANRLQSMVTSLLDFQQTESPDFHLSLANDDLRKVIRERVSSFEMLFRKKNIAFTVSLPEEPVMMDYDFSMQSKILDNLLSNALKYTPENGKVTLELVMTDTQLVLTVSDTGIGIPEKDQRHVFSNFYRARNVMNSNVTGTGIGLLLTKRLIENHGGTITFESVQNHGTTFTVTYPNPKSQNLITSKPHDLRTSSTTHLILVEDNDELRQYLASRFNSSYDIEAFATAEEGLRAIQSNNDIALIISDVMLPGMQGDELCNIVKNNIITSHIPVLLLTAKADKQSVLHGLDAGADDYLTKPFDIDILLSKVDTIIRNRNRQRQYLLSTVIGTVGKTAEYSANSCKKENNENQLTPPSFSANAMKASPSSPSAGVGELPGELELDFLKRCTDFVNANLSNSDFSTIELANEMAMSRTLFYGKIKGLTGKSPKEFITDIRMNEASALLRKGMSVQEVAYKTGFNDAKYFSTAFKKYYGISPSQYR